MRTRTAILWERGRPRPYAESRPLDISEVELDPPGSGELLVRVDAAGLCHSDLSVVDDSRPRPVPMAIGHEAAGTVEGVGPGVADISVGDRVVLVFVPHCGMCRECGAGRPALCERAAVSNTAGEMLRGGRRLHTIDGQDVNHHLGVSAFSEHVVVDRGSVVVVPDDVPAPVAALFGCALLTGFGAVHNTAGVRAGQSVAVFGLGGVGLASVLGAVVAGAHPIVAIDPVEEKRALALELGATIALAPEQATVEAVRELVPDGLDATFEAVGSAAVLAEAWAITGRGGTTVSIGLPHPTQELRLPAVQIVGEARTLVGSYMGSSVPARDIPRLVNLWRSGRLPVERLQTAAISFEELNASLDTLADGRSVRQVLLPHGAA